VPTSPPRHHPGHLPDSGEGRMPSYPSSGVGSHTFASNAVPPGVSPPRQPEAIPRRQLGELSRLNREDPPNPPRRRPARCSLALGGTGKQSIERTRDATTASSGRLAKVISRGPRRRDAVVPPLIRRHKTTAGAAHVVPRGDDLPARGRAARRRGRGPPRAPRSGHDSEPYGHVAGTRADDGGGRPSPELFGQGKAPGQERRAWDSNPRWVLPHSGFQDRRHRPLGEPSWHAEAIPRPAMIIGEWPAPSACPPTTRR
jgi:hypothetical protein